jgi:trypsin-like peptidase
MLKCFVLLVVFIVLAPVARAQDEHVYLIKMFDCTHKPAERSQTGFRVRGIKGLVTALHGIADCQKIMASSKNGLFLDQPLTINKMDVDHDVALLSSPQIDSAPDGGLNIADNVDWKSLGMVKVYGHPYGISNLETTLTLRNPPLRPLNDLVPAAPLSILKERRSPNHLINVLNLQGNLLPGHSGAPILDSKGNVVAVANGGLKEGFAGISWAVPYKDIEWDSLGGKLRVLAQIDPSILFATDALPVVAADESENDFCGQLSKLIAESRTDFISIIGDPVSETLTGMFISKITLPGAISGRIISSFRSLTYTMYEWNQIARVESQYYSLVAKVSACLPAWERKEGQDLKVGEINYRQYKFRDKDKGVSIVVDYNLDLSFSKKYELRLTLYPASTRYAQYGW